jgi:cytochrome P450
MLPFGSDERGRLDPEIGYSADAVCPMRLPATGAEVLVLRDYETVVTALGDRRFSIAEVGEEYVTIGSAYRSEQDLPKMDPPATTAIRRPLGTVFAEQAIAKHRPAVERAAAELADRLAGMARPTDLMSGFCEPFIAEAVSVSMGIPVADWPYILNLGGRGLGTVANTDEAADRRAAWDELYEYSEKLVERKRADPDGLLLSAIVAVLQRAGLPKPTVLHTVATVVVGLPTPIGAMEIVAFELLRRPDVVRERLAEPARWLPTINELMRLRANFALALPRVAVEDVQLNGYLVARGQVVVPSLLAAAHDPARTERPEEFDASQTAARNIVFGAGAHLCPGAALGRQWLEVGLAAMFNRLPGLRLAARDEELRWQDGTLAIPEEMPVVWE